MANKICIQCDRKHYAKNYCRKHYVFNSVKRKFGHFVKCAIEDCQNGAREDLSFCSRHRQRIEKGLPLDLSKKYMPKGRQHHWWKGGKIEYPGQYLMKKNRLILFLNNPICTICKIKPAEHVHHKDHSKDNHNLDNLTPICSGCHAKIHWKDRKTT